MESFQDFQTSYKRVKRIPKAKHFSQKLLNEESDKTTYLAFE